MQLSPPCQYFYEKKEGAPPRYNCPRLIVDEYTRGFTSSGKKKELSLLLFSAARGELDVIYINLP